MGPSGREPTVSGSTGALSRPAGHFTSTALYLGRRHVGSLTRLYIAAWVDLLAPLQVADGTDNLRGHVAARGSIITTSSPSACIAHPQSHTACAAAKAGIESLAENLAVQMGPCGTRVNCITSATILTNSNRNLIPEDVQTSLAEQHPLQRLGTPADLASFLASERALWITGAIVDVAGRLVTR